MNKNIKANFSVRNEFSDKDARFLEVEIDVLHTGANFNGSSFGKEVVNSCVDSIKNTPILGYIKYDKITESNDFKGHEYIITKTENGVEDKYIGHAFGIIPESCNPRWVTKMCDDGIEREFLRVNGLLWEKFEDATSIIHRDGSKSQSMELEISSYDGYEDDDNVFHFTKFQFNGCCILGDDYEPAMINSVVNPVNTKFNSNDFASEIKNELEKYFSLKNIAEKGEKDLDNKPDFTQTVMQQFGDIGNIIREKEKIQDRWGDLVSRYQIVDIQENEVIVVDMKDNYNYYSFPLSFSGDKPVIDFESPKRKKISYTDYEETDLEVFNLTDFLEKKDSESFAKIETLKAEKEGVEKDFTSLKEEHETLKTNYGVIKEQYDKYLEAEKAKEEEELNKKKEAEFAKYECVLGSNEEFNKLKENISTLNLEEIEVQSALLYAKTTLKTDFSKKNTEQTAIPIPNTNENENYISTIYGNIPVKKEGK